MKGPAYHARTHRVDGTDPIPASSYRAWLYTSSVASEAVLTEGDTDISCRFRTAQFASGDVQHNTIGLTLAGSPTGSTFVLPRGLYDIRISIRFSFPRPQVTSTRYVGADLGGWASPSALPTMIPWSLPVVPISTTGTGTVYRHGGNQWIVGVDDDREFSILSVEDEQSSSYRAATVTFTVSIVKFDSAF